MVFNCPLLVVKDMDRSRWFYEVVLGQKVLYNWDNYFVTYKGIFSIQREDKWTEETGHLDVDRPRSEIYFEEYHFDNFLERLLSFPEVVVLASLKLKASDQRIIRLLDPDGHIIKVGESMQIVIKRYLDSGMSISQVANFTNFPETYISAIGKKYVHESNQAIKDISGGYQHLHKS